MPKGARKVHDGLVGLGRTDLSGYALRLALAT
jgi:hypothetical protein